MSLLEAIVYGLVQGATEWLPVSSTAHLRLTPEVLGHQDPGSAFTAVIQLGTTLAVIVYFRREILASLKAMFSSRDTPERRTAWGAVIGTIPIVIVALLAKDLIKGPFRSMEVIIGALVVGSAMMFAADRRQGGRGAETITVLDGIKIGLFQCLALVPGMSRSGSTISGARFIGFDRVAAARTSFLMSIPATAAAGLYEAYSDGRHLAGDMLVPTLVATLVAGIVGYLTIGWLIGIVQRRGILPFIIYRLGLAAVLGVLLATGVLNGRSSAQRVVAPLPGAHANRVENLRHENLPIADVAGTTHVLNRFERDL